MKLKLLLTYPIVLCAFLLMDGLWLGVIAGETYNRALGPLLRDDFLLWPATLFYLIYTLAICHLVVFPQRSQDKALSVLCSGGLLGLAAYGAFDLTSYAIIKDWPLPMTLIDMAWGTFITASCSLVGWLFVKKL